MPSPRFILFLALFSSGAAGLAYQNAWGRLLHRVFGVGDQAIAIVLATYFLGLGVGSYVGGLYAERLRRPAFAYGVLEIAIAIFAAVSAFTPSIFLSAYGSLGAALGENSLVWIRFGIAAVMLLPPTLMMGATLPFLVRAAARENEEWTRSATYLYVLNTLGAVFGAAASGFYLIPSLGTRITLFVAAAASVFAALIVFLFFGRREEAHGDNVATTAAGAAKETSDPTGPDVRPEFPLIAPLLAASAGALALSAEILWTRILRTIVQGTTQAFAAMLVSFLLGIALGSLLAERFGRGRRALFVFGIAQVLAALLTAIAIYFTPEIPRLLVLIHGEPSVVPHQAWVILLASFILLFPLALALGTSIPLLFRIEGELDDANAGRHAGRVLAANTMGGLFGALFVGFIAIPAPWGGIENSLITIIGLHLLLATIALSGAVDRRFGARVTALSAPFALFTLILLAQPSLELPYLLHAASQPVAATVEGRTLKTPRLAFYEEGRSTTVTILDHGPHLQLLNDGRPESGINFGSTPFGAQLVGLGGLPALFSKERGTALIIGLGGGHTARLALDGGYEKMIAIELEEGVDRAARHLYEARAAARQEESLYPIDDPRAELIIDDARARLTLLPEGSLDAVVSQPSHPWLAGSSALYTLEFFRQVASRLRDGGVFSLWLNRFRIDLAAIRDVTRTLLEVFPSARLFIMNDESVLFIATKGESRLDSPLPERFEETEALRASFESVGIGALPELLARHELSGDGLRAFAEKGAIILDDQPVLELRLQRIRPGQGVSDREIADAFESLPFMSTEDLNALEAETIRSLFRAKIERAAYNQKEIDRIELTLSESTIDAESRAYIEGAIAEARGLLDDAVKAYHRSDLIEARAARARIKGDTLPTEEWLALLNDEEAEEAIRREAIEALLRREPALLLREGLNLSGPLGERARLYAEGACPALLSAGMPVEARSVALFDRYLECLGELDPSVDPRSNETEGIDESEKGRLEAERRRALETLRNEAMEHRSALRRGIAHQAYEKALGARRGGSPRAAEHLLKDALAHQPAHRFAAIQLMEILVAEQRHAEAELVLRRSLHYTSLLPEKDARMIRVAARRLGLRPPGDLDALEDAAAEVEVDEVTGAVRTSTP